MPNGREAEEEEEDKERGIWKKWQLSNFPMKKAEREREESFDIKGPFNHITKTQFIQFTFYLRVLWVGTPTTANINLITPTRYAVNLLHYPNTRSINCSVQLMRLCGKREALVAI